MNICIYTHICMYIYIYMAGSHLFVIVKYGRAIPFCFQGVWGVQPPRKGPICHVYLIISYSMVALETVLCNKVKGGRLRKGANEKVPYLSLSLSLPLSLSLYIYIYIFMYTHIYIYMYIHTYSRFRPTWARLAAREFPSGTWLWRVLSGKCKRRRKV